MTLAWYDPTNQHVSTNKNDPMFTPLGQLWSLDVKREWVGLTGLELRNIARQFPEHHRVFEDHWDVIVNLLHEAGAQLKGKNT
jgi:hypothetical protein